MAQARQHAHLARQLLLLVVPARVLLLLQHLDRDGGAAPQALVDLAHAALADELREADVGRGDLRGLQLLRRKGGLSLARANAIAATLPRAGAVVGVELEPADGRATPAPVRPPAEEEEDQREANAAGDDGDNFDEAGAGRQR